MKPIELNIKDIDLTNKKIDKKDLKPLNVLFFYADWCGHCVNFRPTYNTASNAVGSLINFYQFNEKKSDEVLTAFKVKAFPTIFLINKNGKVIKEYKGPRDSEHSFVAELCKMSLNCPRKYL